MSHMVHSEVFTKRVSPYGSSVCMKQVKINIMHLLNKRYVLLVKVRVLDKISNFLTKNFAEN